MKFRKRQLILASLVVALGTAVYLNWQFSGSGDMEVTNIAQSTQELGEARYVNNSNLSKKTDKISSGTISEESKKYFAEAEINRQKSRDESQEKLKSLMLESQITQDIKNKISSEIECISKNIQQESNIENIIKSKGFSHSLAFIQNGECSVVLEPEAVNENSVLIVRDIVSGQSGIPGNKIKIIEAKSA